jgi:hypothetical protein
VQFNLNRSIDAADEDDRHRQQGRHHGPLDAQDGKRHD